MLRHALAALARTALLPVRAPAQLLQANQHFYLPVLNGALGDQLAARHDPRAIAFSFREAGLDVGVPALQLPPGPARKTVVFVHGLMGDELIWQGAAPPDPLRYGPRLAAAVGMQALYVRYNSGLHISENGRALAAALAALVAAYPEAIGELVLVGHSMGGLVIRSAGYYAGQLPGGPDWLARLRAVFLLGVPHEGSYLEQNSAAVERLLRRLDVLPTRLAGQVMARRSNGIKDLGRALLIDEDWQPGPAPAGEAPPRTPVPLLPGVAYHVLVGSWLGAGRAQALRDYLGDGLVSTASGLHLAAGPDELPPGTTLHTARFAARHHGGLLRDEAVYQYLRQWL